MLSFQCTITLVLVALLGFYCFTDAHGPPFLDRPIVRTTTYEHNGSFDDKPLFFEGTNSAIYPNRRLDIFFVSHNAGRTWTPARGVPSGLKEAVVVMHPFDNCYAFILTDTTVHYRTSDSGHSWTAFNTPHPPVFRPAVLPVYARDGGALLNEKPPVMPRIGSHPNPIRPLVFHSHWARRAHIIFQGYRCENYTCWDETYYTTDAFTVGENTRLLLPNMTPVGCQFAYSSLEFGARLKALHGDAQVQTDRSSTIQTRLDPNIDLVLCAAYLYNDPDIQTPTSQHLAPRPTDGHGRTDPEIQHGDARRNISARHSYLLASTDYFVSDSHILLEGQPGVTSLSFVGKFAVVSVKQFSHKYGAVYLYISPDARNWVRADAEVEPGASQPPEYDPNVLTDVQPRTGLHDQAPMSSGDIEPQIRPLRFYSNTYYFSPIGLGSDLLGIEDTLSQYSETYHETPSRMLAAQYETPHLQDVGSGHECEGHGVSSEEGLGRVVFRTVLEDMHVFQVYRLNIPGSDLDSEADSCAGLGETKPRTASVALANIFTNKTGVDTEKGKEPHETLRFKYLRTRISFDGETWAELRLQTNLQHQALAALDSALSFNAPPTPSSSLHLHLKEWRSGALSSPSAPRVLIAVGSVSPVLLEPNDCDTYLSRDAGQTWKRVLVGPWKTAIGQGGRVILAVRDADEPEKFPWGRRVARTSSVRYSFDLGESWHDLSVGFHFRPGSLVSVPGPPHPEDPSSGSDPEHQSFILMTLDPTWGGIPRRVDAVHVTVPVRAKTSSSGFVAVRGSSHSERMNLSPDSLQLQIWSWCGLL